MTGPMRLALLQQAPEATAPLATVSAPEHFGVWLLATLIKMLVLFTIYMVGVAMLTLFERKVAAWIQDRLGPNRVGPRGLLQPAADGLKNIMKEETYPGQAYKPLFVLAPALAFIPALMTWAVIPFGAPWYSRWGVIDMALAPMPIGFLYILSIASLGVYGIVLAGWASNNKYSLLGGLRASAQMISYEIAMGLSTIPVLLLAGNVSLSAIVAQQTTTGRGWPTPLSWNVFLCTMSFIIFLISAFAETNRLPFDMAEAESELIAGYHSEYSAMKFSMFFIAEYANMVTASALLATLFFGGWDIPFWTHDNTSHSLWMTLLTALVFFAKIMCFVFLYMWIRWTLPRFRYDQLMALGWKVLLPLALAYIVAMAAAILGVQAAGYVRGSWQFGLALLVLNVVFLVVVFGIVDRGRIVSPAYSRLDRRDLQKLQRAAIDRARFAPAEVGE
ncbi:MAG TPA: NADH-quinone oxidoreductase subunit NuoH [Gemmatimonadaceae bacterium]|nr:NADH-quinone oxidoreductase subunit NuoH [Gemmatimonadaceae bacterium]